MARDVVTPPEAEIVFLDKTDNTTIATMHATGNPGDPVKFEEDPQMKILELESQGYVLGFNGWWPPARFGDTGTQTFEVHFTHRMEDLNETYNYLVQYTFSEYYTGKTLADTVNKSARLVATGKKDMVTGKVTWDKDYSYTFPPYTLPQFPGLIPQENRKEFDAITVRIPDGDQRSQTIIAQTWYLPTYEGSITYIDDDENGKVLQKLTTPEANTDPDYNFQNWQTYINYYTDNGYDLVDNGYTGAPLKGYPEANAFEIHFKHKRESITHTKSITRTVKYWNDDTNSEVHAPDVETITFTQSGYKDLATGETVYTQNYEPQTFSDIDPPYIAGMQCMQEGRVPAETVVYDPNLTDREVTVHYKSVQKATIDFIDDTTGRTLYSTSTDGITGAQIYFIPDPYAQILSYENKGYSLISSNWEATARFDKDPAKNAFQVHFGHQSKDVSQQQTVKVTYNFFKSGTIQKVHPSLTDEKTLTRTGKQDRVTGQTVWDENPSCTFKPFTLPKITGYVARQSQSTGLTTTLDDETEQEYTQNYYYDPIYQGEVRIIDDTTGETLQTLSTKDDNIDRQVLTAINPQPEIDKWIAKGYHLVTGNWQNKDMLPWPAPNSYEVHLSHQTQPVQNNKTVTRTINYVSAADNSPVAAPVVQTVTLTVNGTKDLVTGDITEASVVPSSFEPVASPGIEHMKCLQPSVPAQNLDSLDDLKDSTVTVYYQPENSAVVEFIDDDNGGEVIQTLTAEGVNGKPIVFEGEGPYEVIANLGKQHYKVVSNNWKTGSIYSADSDNRYSVHLAHYTEPASVTHKITYTIHFLDQETGAKLLGDRTQTTDLTQTGTKDLVTGDIKWNPAPSWTTPEADAPQIAGYKAVPAQTGGTTISFDESTTEDNVPFAAQDTVYYSKIYTGTLKIIDDSTGETLKTYTTPAQNTVQAYDFGEDADLQNYQSNGYEQVSDNYDGSLEWQAKNAFEIHLKHKTKDEDRTESYTRTIHFVSRKTGDKVADDQKQTIAFQLTDTIDEVTGKILQTVCSNSRQSYPELTAPAVEGMSPLTPSVSKETVEWKEGLKDSEATIEYAKTEEASIRFVDDTTGKDLSSLSATGPEGSSITFSKDPDAVVKEYEGKGWKLVSSDWNAGSTYGDSNAFTVHLTHSTEPYSETRTYTDECRYVDIDTNQDVQDPSTRTVKLTGKGTRDLVTGQITWTDTPSYTFPAIDVPKVTGYKNPDWNGQSYTVTFGGSSLKTVVPYKKVYSGTLKIIDDTTKTTLDTLSITDSFDDAADFGQQNLIDGYKGMGYELVSDSSNGKTLAWQPAVNAFEIHLKHKMDPVDGQKTVNRYIHYTNAVTNATVAPSVTQTVTLNVRGEKDAVTGDTNWISDYALYSFAEVWSPKIKDMRCLMPLVEAEPIEYSPDLQDTTVNVRYQPEQQALIDFIDDDDNGKIVAYYATQGVQDQPIIFPAEPANTIASLEARGYKLVSSDWNDGAVYQEEGNNHFTVHLKHNTEQDSRKRTITRTIHYVDEATGQTLEPDKVQSVSFEDTGTKDLVTGKTKWNTGDSKKIEAVESPVISGMICLMPSVPALIVPDSDAAKDSEVTVKYRQNLTAGITYYDDTDNTVILQASASGAPGKAIVFKTAPADQINTFTDDGYELVSSDWKDGATFSKDSASQFTVHLKHKTESISRKQTVKVHYSFIDAKTGASLKDGEDKTHLLTWNGTKDLVTNKESWDDEPSYTFAAIDSPAIDGYQPALPQIGPVTVSFSQMYADAVMDYNPVYSGTLKIIDDTTGNVLNTRTITDSLSKKADFQQASLLDGYLEQGYELVSDNTIDANLNPDPKQNSYEIHLKHRMDSKERTASITRTIHYVKDGTNDKVAPDFSQTLTFVQTGNKDYVTGKTVWDEVKPQSFAAVKSPDVDGLYCLSPEVAKKQIVFADDLKDYDVTVRYQPAGTATLDFIDDDEDGKLLDSFSSQGSANTPITFKEDPQAKISQLQKQNYVLKSNDWENGKLFSEKGPNHYEVHFTHKKAPQTKTGTYTLTVLCKDAATQEIIYPEADKIAEVFAAVPDATDTHAYTITHSFTIKGEKDLVTGKTTWQPAEGYTFDSFKVPEIAGYKPESEDVDPQHADSNNPNLILTVYYDKVYGATLNVIDLTDNKQLETVLFPSSPTNQIALNQDKRIKAYEDLGYEFDSCNFDRDAKYQTVPDNRKAATYNLYLKHQLIPGEEKNDLVRTINYIEADTGNVLAPANTQSVSYCVKTMTDKITGVTTKTPCDPMKFDAVTSPVIKGYDCEMPVVEAMEIPYSDDLGNITINVRYVVPDNQAVIQYFDDDASDGHTPVKGLRTIDAVSGKKGSPIKFTEDPSTVIKNWEDKGYELVSNNFTDGDQFGQNSHAYEVHFKHKKEDVSLKNVKRTIYLVDQNGNQLQDPVVQEVKIDHPVQKDLVLGTYTPEAEEKYPEYSLPEIDGYSHKEKSVPEATVNYGDPNSEVRIVYTKDMNPSDPGNTDDPGNKNDPGSKDPGNNNDPGNKDPNSQNSPDDSKNQDNKNDQNSTYTPTQHPVNTDTDSGTSSNGSSSNTSTTQTTTRTPVISGAVNAGYSTDSTKKSSVRSSVSTAVHSGFTQAMAWMSAAAAGLAALLGKKRRK